MAETLSDALRKLEEATRGKITAEADQLKKAIDNFKPQIDEMKTQAEEMGKELDRRVHEKPWTAVGVAAVVFLFIGYLMGRRD